MGTGSEGGQDALARAQLLMQAGKGEGMQTMEMALRTLALRREITREQAILACNSPDMFNNDDIGRRRPPGR